MISNRTISRRQMMRLGVAGLAGVGLTTQIGSTCHSRQVQPSAVSGLEPSPALGGDAAGSLKELAATKGVLYGSSVRFPALQSDAEIIPAFERECTIFVAEDAMKWTKLRPSLDRFDFSWGDWLIEFAQTREILFRGHTLVWNQSNPPWLREYATRQNAEQLMTDHIKTVMGHYAGKIHSWDVVNEAVQLGEPNYLKKSIWRDLIGPDYIELAFQAAAEADPASLLVFNENRFEYESRDADARRGAMLEILANLKAKGVPVQALGIQAHLRGSLTQDINHTRLREFLKNVADLGLKILITELDVIDEELPADVNERDRLVAAAYEEYLTTVLDEPAVIAVMTWGLSDRYTWISKYFPRSDNLPVRPLPLDLDLNRKPAWDAIARAFSQTPPR